MQQATGLDGRGWSVRSAGVGGLVAVLGAAVVAVAAQVSLPIGPVPVTLQTAVMFWLAVVFGARSGLLAAGIYLLAACVGAPVLSGWSSFAPTGLWQARTAGYVVGFLPAVVVLGSLAARGRLRRWPGRLLWLLVGHALVLAVGGSWLAMHLGGEGAWRHGVAPFLIGAVGKSVAVTVLAAPWLRTEPAASAA